MYIWLVNVMEGFMLVFVFIYVVMMVIVGVYLVIRVNFLYSVVFEVGYFIVCLGVFVVFFGVSMVLVNKDLKRIVVYFMFF